MKQRMFTKTKLATSLSLVLGTAVLSHSAIAAEAKDKTADEKNVEVIQVTGFRSSIKESTRLKRDANGVVDAISAEDIGKFPDTNLAESLQRITGVSISRSNGEGSQVTVRGFGPDFNMVTLNGRTMPASSLPYGGGNSSSRAFDMSNLASESVKAVEVYKTGKASVATGGIGATINIVTGRPLDNPGTKASFGAKAVADTTNEVGSNITPELSSFLSWTDPEEVFGVSLSASYQKRNSGSTGAYVNQWRTSAFDGTLPNSPVSAASGAPIVLNSAPAIGQLHSLPSDLRYFHADRERTRTNAQLTLQYRPAENITATLDYTYAGQELYENRAEQSIWMDSYKTDLTFDSETVATPVVFIEDRREQAPRDLGLALQQQNQKNENKSLGFNVDYEVNDYLSLRFDFHDSSAESTPNADYGNWINVGLGANVVAGQSAQFNNSLPLMNIVFDDCDPRRALNCNGQLDPSDVGTQMGEINNDRVRTDITQTRIDGTYEDESGDWSIDFGIEARSMENHSQTSWIRNEMGGWGAANPGELPDGYLTPIDYSSLFNDYDTTGGLTTGLTGDAAQIGEWGANNYGFNWGVNPNDSVNRLIKEDTTAAYAQFNYGGEINDLPFHVVAGLRYEKTDVTSSSNINLVSQVFWQSNNDFNLPVGSETSSFQVDSSYNYLLPSLDFDIDLKEDVKARFSYSKTIARPTYNNLSSAITGLGGPDAPTILGGAPGGATAGNPSLKPLVSNNYDISAEWYFEETSYVSLGYYLKKVDNFIGVEPVTQSFFGLTDPSAGPRAQAALAELNAQNIPVNDTNLFSMAAAMQLGVDYSSMTAEEFENAVDIVGDSSDPLLQFRAQQPVNNKSAKIDGFEFAVQHFFGDSGFGFQANYTTVNGDIGFDINSDPSVTQFALVGLSDTANLVLMYEKDDWQGRIAYNWRDKYLYSAAIYQNEPSFTEAHSQIDFNVGYKVSENLSVAFEGLNITGENSRRHGRTNVQLNFMEQLGARYQLSARYTF